jgi:regulator of sirC expression with transglutaminase-like and TPR domain
MIVELWPERDEASLRACLAAVAQNDLVGALFAIEGADAGVQAADRELLASWAADVARRVDSTRPPLLQATVLRDLLGVSLGFRGDAANYHAIENSHLHRVLKRRRGLPILLSCVWIAVGRLAGLRVDGIGLPGHFIVRVADEVLVDPFSGGRTMTGEDCRELVSRLSESKIEFDERMLASAELDSIIERVLTNLVNATSQAQDTHALYRVLRFLGALRPDAPVHDLRRAQVAAALGARMEAIELCTRIARDFPNTSESSAADSLRARIGSPTLN